MPGRGGVQKQIISGYLKRYFLDSELEEIAENTGNIKKQTDIYVDVLKRNMFPDVFFDGTYQKAIGTFIEQIERIYPSIVTRQQQLRLGIKPRRKPIIKKRKKREFLGKQKKTQKSRTGTTYSRVITRGSGYYWTKNQTKLLQINKEKVNMGIIGKKEAIRDTARISGRTEKSVESKYYRINIP